jgi:hypothetical protein
MLREIARGTRSKTGGTRLQAEESMDDGAKIVISINIDENEVHTYVECDLIILSNSNEIGYVTSNFVRQLHLLVKINFTFYLVGNFDLK